jgi:hypothetical protein
VSIVKLSSRNVFAIDSFVAKIYPFESSIGTRGEVTVNGIKTNLIVEIKLGQEEPPCLEITRSQSEEKCEVEDLLIAASVDYQLLKPPDSIVQQYFKIPLTAIRNLQIYSSTPLEGKDV